LRVENPTHEVTQALQPANAFSNFVIKKNLGAVAAGLGRNKKPNTQDT